MGTEHITRRWVRLGLAVVLSAGAIAAGATEAGAFSRGLASKVRAMQAQAFADRFSSARTAFAGGDFQRCVQEAELAMTHVANEDQATATHQLLAAAYKKLNNPTAAAPHQAWLSEHRKR